MGRRPSKPLIPALAVTAVLLLPGAANAATTYTYPSAACPQSATGLDNCINNVASDGDTISIKPGIYHEAGTPVTNEVTVMGALDKKKKCKSPSAVVITPDQAGDGFYVTADNVTIQCLEIDHPGSSWDGVEEDGGFDNLRILNVVVTDAGFGVFTRNGAADGLQVKNSTMRGTNSYGIRINDTPDNVKISGNLIRNTGSDSIFVQDGATNTTISNNTMLVASGSGIYFPGGGGPVSVTGNVIRAAGSTGIDIGAPNTTISGNTIDTATVQAIFFNGDNTTVTNNLLMGSFNSNAIDGECGGSSHDTVTISGNVLATSSGANGDFICAWYDNATITNNTANGFVNGYGIRVGDSGPHFANPVITGNKLLGGVTGIGIYVWGDNLKVNGNTVANTISDGMDLYCTTDAAADCSAAQVKNNIQSAAPSGCYGIYIYTYGTGLTASGNQTNDNTCYGLYFDSSLATSSVTVMNNVAKQNGFATEAYGGIIFGAGGGNTISGNKALGNGGEGIYVYTDGNTLSGNTTKNNVLHGVEISESGDSNTLNGNTSKNNLGDGFNNDGTNTSFTNNTASGNHRDCTNDVGEGATLGTVSGNSCADGHVFDWETLLTDL